MELAWCSCGGIVDIRRVEINEKSIMRKLGCRMDAVILPHNRSSFFFFDGHLFSRGIRQYWIDPGRVAVIGEMIFFFLFCRLLVDLIIGQNYRNWHEKISRPLVLGQ